MKRLTFLLFGILIVGCATTSMNMRITKPAEINLAGINKIAIGEITGPSNSEVTEVLTTKLFNSGRFEVLDRQHVDQLFTEHKLTFSGVIDENTAVEIGKLIGSAALIFGRVSNHKYDEKWEQNDWKDDKGNSHRRYTRSGQADVSMSLQLTDLRTGKIIAIKQLSNTQKGKTSATDKYPDKIDSDKLLEDARGECIQAFMRSIAPYQVNEKVAFENDKKVPEIVSGITFAKTGDIQRAAESFRKSVETNPTNPKAHYNLGIALMCLGQYNEAINELDKAYGIAPSKKYASSLSKCNTWKRDSEKLQEQIRGVK